MEMTEEIKTDCLLFVNGVVAVTYFAQMEGRCFPCKHFRRENDLEEASRRACGPFGKMPEGASAFISASRLLNTDARKGIGVH